MKPTRKRSRAREIAVQALYQFDAHRRASGADDPAAAQSIGEFIDREAEDPEVREFAQELVDGTRESMPEIDELLAGVVEKWKPERIAAMDRAILRLAAHELTSRLDIPPKVAINEAIELAKKFSTAESGAFVNGILDRILQLRRAEEKETG